MKRILVLAATALSLYSMGPAMADSMLGETREPPQQHQSPAPQVARRYQPIRNGYNLQPTQSEIAKPDISAEDGKVVDELYRKLMQEERARYPDLFRSPKSEPAAEPPTSSKDPR